MCCCNCWWDKNDTNFITYTCKTSASSHTLIPSFFALIIDDGKLQAESDSGEFWVLFGGFAPIGKKTISDDDVVLEITAPKLFRYVFFMSVQLVIFDQIF